MNNELIEKLRKLIALAGNNPSVHEAEAAMLKAQSIALEHGIDIAMVSKEKKKKTEFTRDTIFFGGRLPIQNDFITNILTKFFDVKVFSSGSRDSGRLLYFIGVAENVKVAQQLYKFLREAMDSCWKKYFHSTPNISLAFKKSYFLGFYNGLCNKLEKNKQVIEANMLVTGEAQTCYALACVEKKSEMDLYIANNFKTTTPAPKKTMYVNAGSYSAGYKDGSEIKLFNELVAS